MQVGTSFVHPRSRERAERAVLRPAAAPPSPRVESAPCASQIRSAPMPEDPFALWLHLGWGVELG